MTSKEILRGQVIEEETTVTMQELCFNCAVEAEEILLMVEEGILDPAAGERSARTEPGTSGEWQFHISSVKRVRTVVHLQRDLGVNLAGAALALELLDQIFELKTTGPRHRRSW